ncbi:hypothetical protein GCM10010211_65610 [Streptomyces albospinus]|uniref:Transposase n=1 Tax=Streptomyces albospinus TaxID=285515 RepID=A0ABQ2VMK4_9ACTN|nr:hypothetical protein GCM10010211_65610 [Streptomyces albospinus]
MGVGPDRWVLERAMSWRSGYRRRGFCYERDLRNYPVFLGLAAVICDSGHLLRLTTEDTV